MLHIKSWGNSYQKSFELLSTDKHFFSSVPLRFYCTEIWGLGLCPRPLLYPSYGRFNNNTYNRYCYHPYYEKNIKTHKKSFYFATEANFLCYYSYIGWKPVTKFLGLPLKVPSSRYLNESHRQALKVL